MFSSKTKKPRNIRQKIALTHLESDEDDLPAAKNIYHNPEIPPSVGKNKKLKQNISLHAPSQDSRAYNDEVLKALKQNQLKKPSNMFIFDHDDICVEETFIPTESQIDQIKRQKQQKMQKNQEDDFAPVNDFQVSTHVRESRLVTEDQDDDENFEDYNDQILFGNDAIKKAALLKMKEIEQAQKELDEYRKGNEEEWELQMIHRGIDERHLSEKITIEKPVITVEEELQKIPELIDLEQIDDCIQTLAQTVSEFINHHESNLQQLDFSSKDIIQTKSSITNSVVITQNSSDRYEFFQNLKEFCLDFQEFLEEKFPIIENLELQVLSISSQTANEKWRIKWSALDSKFTQFIAAKTKLLNTDDYLALCYENNGSTQSASEIQLQIRELFSDTSNQYLTISTIKQKFEAWKRDYSKEFEQSYAALTLAAAFEIYIRYELIEWR